MIIIIIIAARLTKASNHTQEGSNNNDESHQGHLLTNEKIWWKSSVKYENLMKVIFKNHEKVGKTDEYANHEKNWLKSFVKVCKGD